MTRANFIVAAAKWYVGRMEKKGNSGFVDAAFEKEMKAVGWYMFAPWCAFFTKLIFTKAYRKHKELLSLVTKSLTGSALGSLKNIKRDGTFEVSDTPKVGAIVVWALGSGPRGHVGIVCSVNENNTMITCEGNTNALGGREGNVVAMKARTIERPFRAKGLNVRGYIYPKEKKKNE